MGTENTLEKARLLVEMLEQHAQHEETKQLGQIMEYVMNEAYVRMHREGKE